jgi:hypothetical protein
MLSGSGSSMGMSRISPFSAETISANWDNSPALRSAGEFFGQYLRLLLNLYVRLPPALVRVIRAGWG